MPVSSESFSFYDVIFFNLYVYLFVCLLPFLFSQVVAFIVQNSAWYSGLSMNICRMNEQVKEEAELDSVILQTHPWCWPAVLMGFPCSTPSVLDTSLPLPTVNRQNGLLLHRQNRSHLEATSLTNLQTASLHTHPFRLFPDTMEVCDPSLVCSMPQTQGLCLSCPIPFCLLRPSHLNFCFMSFPSPALILLPLFLAFFSGQASH